MFNENVNSFNVYFFCSMQPSMRGFGGWILFCLTEKQWRIMKTIISTMRYTTYPCVVEAVTDTIIIVACVRKLCRVSLFLALSKSLPNSFTVRMYSNGVMMSDSSSGNLFWYLSRTNLWIIAGKWNYLFKVTYNNRL